MSDLSAEVLAEHLGARPVRTYPALLSTSADAQAWARAGAPSGAVVVAGYQASPRGRAGWPWDVVPESDLCFSLVVHPTLSAEREGWLYLATLTGLSNEMDASELRWPDELWRGQERLAAVGLETGLGPKGIEWAVINVWLPGPGDERPAALARAVRAIEHGLAADAEEVLALAVTRCATLGRRVTARMIPLGPGGPEVAGEAVDCLADGALVILTDTQSRVAVRPQHLGQLEPLD